MNVTYVYNSYKQPDIIFADFYNEIWAIIVLCVLILTRGIVSTVLKLINNEPVQHHVHYSNEYSTSDLRLDLAIPKPKPKPNLNPPGAPPNSPKSEFDPYELKPKTPKASFKKPKIPPRDELV